MSQNTLLPAGVWPAMITAFTRGKSIDWPGIDALTEWYITSGVSGLFAVGQSSEMFALDNAERLALAAHVVKRADGRVPVVASGTFGGPIDQQAQYIQQMYDTGVKSVTVLINALAEPEEDETVCWGRLEQLLEQTGDIPLSLYECPQPYRRPLSPETVQKAASTGRFHLYKETTRSLDLVKAKVEASAGTPLKIYNADTSALLESLRAGAKGYCGIAANFYPALIVWLCTHFTDQPEKSEQVQAFLASVDNTIHHKYPLCAKYLRRKAGSDMLEVCRVTDAVLGEYEQRSLDAIMYQANLQLAALIQ